MTSARSAIPTRATPATSSRARCRTGVSGTYLAVSRSEIAASSGATRNTTRQPTAATAQPVNAGSIPQRTISTATKTPMAVGRCLLVTDVLSKASGTPSSAVIPNPSTTRIASRKV
jgi:hypothetical protein